MPSRSSSFARPDRPDDADGLTPFRTGASARPRLLSLLTLDRLFVATICAASIGFFAMACLISMNDPDYFSRRLLASLPTSGIDPITTGAVAAAAPEAGEGGGAGEAMPVPRIVRDRPLAPQDFQIVMVFEDEAILATEREIFRVKVGSVVPGLGAVTEIDPTETGGTVVAEKATLRSVAQP